MKILGLGIPELMVIMFLLVPLIVIVVVVVVLLSRNPKQQQPPQPPSVEASTNPAAPNSIEQLRNYKELLDMGILTHEEFEQKKKELLGL